jgi:hypothetical protein
MASAADTGRINRVIQRAAATIAPAKRFILIAT